jgi:hypothetical protein
MVDGKLFRVIKDLFIFVVKRKTMFVWPDYITFVGIVRLRSARSVIFSSNMLFSSMILYQLDRDRANQLCSSALFLLG